MTRAPGSGGGGAADSPGDSGAAPWTLVYDGECRVCTRMVNVLRDRDRDGLFEMVAYQARGVPERFPDISGAEFRESVQLIGPDGRRWQGAAAIEQIFTLVPRARPLAWLFRIPFARPIARLAYRLFARNRHKLGCGDHCPIG